MALSDKESAPVMGRIHSTESFGANDGPGIRYVIFTRGCNMRCKYCHNPDSWAITGGEEISSEELFKKAVRYKSYWVSPPGKKSPSGGITVSGGEPLLQIDFVTDLFRRAKSENVHTCLDTSGSPFTREEPFFGKFQELMKYTDLVLLDIKQIDPVRHKQTTGRDNGNILDMARYLSEIGKPVWIRYVLVPTLSDFDEDIDGLARFIGSLSNVEKVQVLPYHTLGRYKWENLGLKYALDGVEPPTAERIENAEKRLKAGKFSPLNGTARRCP